MENVDRAEANGHAIERFMDFADLKKSRKVIFKMYISTDHSVLSKEDLEEIFFLYNLLEDLEI